MKLTPAAAIFTSACPGPGAGFGKSAYFRFSGPPCCSTNTAFIVCVIFSPIIHHSRRLNHCAPLPEGRVFLVDEIREHERAPGERRYNCFQIEIGLRNSDTRKETIDEGERPPTSNPA